MVFSIISVTTDAILAAEKIIGSAEKNTVSREPEPQVFFFYASGDSCLKLQI